MYGVGEIRRMNEKDGGTTLVIPNEATRAIIRETCDKIIEATTWGTWTERERDRFAFGYVRGRFDQLASDSNPMTAYFARALLVQVNRHGLGFIRRMLHDVTGNQTFSETPPMNAAYTGETTVNPFEDAYASVAEAIKQA